MPEPVREKVLKQTEAAFRAITKANGYNYDVKFISRIHKDVFKFTDSLNPSILISPNSVETRIDQSDPTAIRHQMTIEVWGYFRDATPSFSSNLQYFIADILKVIYAPIVYETSPGNKYADGVTFVGLEVSAENPPEAQVEVIFSVDYFFNKNAP